MMIKYIYRFFKNSGILNFLEKLKIVSVKLEKYEIIDPRKKSLITIFFGSFGGISFLISDFYINYNERLFVLHLKKNLKQFSQLNNLFDSELNQVLVISILEYIILEKDKEKYSSIEYKNVSVDAKYVAVKNINATQNIIINKAGGFFHFYIEVIPILLRHQDKNSNIYFIIEDKPFYESILKFYDVKYVNTPVNACEKFDTIKLSKYYPSVKDILWLQNFNSRFGVIKSTPKRIYITRKNETARRISNEKELFQFLSKLGFEMIDPGQLNFIDQVNYFKNAEFIVSAHGAALSNIIWCNSIVKIVELNGDRDVRWHFAKIANTLNFDYTLLLGKTIDNMYFETNIQSLKKIIQNK
jgi:hypothetical protein